MLLLFSLQIYSFVYFVLVWFDYPCKKVTFNHSFHVCETVPFVSFITSRVGMTGRLIKKARINANSAITVETKKEKLISNINYPPMSRVYPLLCAVYPL